MDDNKCNGLCTANVGGISVVEYGHEEGHICVRPAKGLMVGTFVESLFQIVDQICEHTIVAAYEPDAPETPAKTTTFVDEPVDQATIERAKIPPKIKSTAPAVVQAAKLPIEQRQVEYEFNLTPEEMAELNSISSHTDSNDVGGEPVSPFSSDFSAKPQQGQRPVRRDNKPQSIFDR
jgi:hypothetical protein